MALVFPSNPSVNDTYQVNGRTYVWNGTSWRTVKGGVPDVVPTLDVDNDFNAGGTLHVDSDNSAVGIGTEAPSHQLHLTQDLGVDGALIAYDTLSVGASASIVGDLTVDTDTLHVDSANNRVGIGTTTPSSALHLTGGTSDVQLRVQTTNADPSLLLTTIGQEDWNIGVDYGDSGKLKFSESTTVGIGTAMTIDSSGNVGIGTESPSYPLEVNGIGWFGDSTTWVRLNPTGDQKLELVSDNATGRPYLAFVNKDASGNRDRKGYVGNPQAASDSSDIYLASDQGGVRLNTPGGTRVYVDSTGNVGIGTESPTQKLDIAGNSRFLVDTSESTYVRFGNIHSSNDVASMESYGDAQIVIDSNDNSSGKKFEVKTNGTTGTSLVTVTDAGRLGVNNTSPRHTLTADKSIGIYRSRGNSRGFFVQGAEGTVSTLVVTVNQENLGCFVYDLRVYGYNGNYVHAAGGAYMLNSVLYSPLNFISTVSSGESVTIPTSVGTHIWKVTVTGSFGYPVAELSVTCGGRGQLDESNVSMVWS